MYYPLLFFKSYYATVRGPNFNRGPSRDTVSAVRPHLRVSIALSAQGLVATKSYASHRDEARNSSEPCESGLLNMDKSLQKPHDRRWGSEL